MSIRTAALIAALAAPAAWTIDPGIYEVGSQSAEHLYAQAPDIQRVSPAALSSGPLLLAWLERIDALERAFQRADIVAYLRAEENASDSADEATDDRIGRSLDELERYRCRTLASVGPARLASFIRAEPSLRDYAYSIDACVANAAHVAQDPAAVAAITDPVLASMRDQYRALRAASSDIAANQNAYAAMLSAIAAAGNGAARLRGFSDGAQAAYDDRGLRAADVAAALAYLRASRVNHEYVALRAHLHDAYVPPAATLPEALAEIEAAERPMGETYAHAFAEIFDPSAHRLEVCTAKSCDQTGFSLGYSGTPSLVYVGGFDGSVRAVKVIAHETAHAVHRQFMNEGQRIGFYNRGPHFMFESFAIFNELLFYDHLYRTAQSDAARAHYSGLFVDDAVFQIYGSAKETDLEASIYRGIADRSVRTAADFDRLTTTIFTRYDGVPPSDSGRLYWARDRLFFTDPLYDVNYLFAGMLALTYYRQYEANPVAFQRNYVALLRNGFNDTPAALERRFLAIDLDNVPALLRADDALIEERISTLRALSGSGTARV